MTQNTKPNNLENIENTLLSNLNVVRLVIVLCMAFGYSSTMPLGPEYPEMFRLFGYDPSWIAIKLLFFVSGIMAMRSIEKGRTGFSYLASRFQRNIPLLFLLTIATLIILFPLFGTPSDTGIDFYKRVAEYVLLTTFCISPGLPIQGLMDDAKYMCLIQGGIWTLRYGVILHLACAISGRLGWLSHRLFLLGVTALITLTYIILGFADAKTYVELFDPALTGLRLAYAFLLGMSAWAYGDRLLNLGRMFWLAPSLTFAIAFFNYEYAPWSPLIEVCLSVSFMGLVWKSLLSESELSSITKKCPNLTLAVYMISWPTAQTLLLIAPQLTPWQLILLTLPLTLILSQMVWLLTRNLSPGFPRIQRNKVKTS